MSGNTQPLPEIDPEIAEAYAMLAGGWTLTAEAFAEFEAEIANQSPRTPALIALFKR